MSPRDDLRQWLRTLSHGKDGGRAEGMLDALLAEHRAVVEESNRVFAERLSRARAEALEEAATICDGMTESVFEASPEAESIRALITSPAPATIPVERVREVVANTCDSEDADLKGTDWVRDTILSALGVDLDAKGEADDDDEECVPAHELPGSEVPS